MTNHLAIATVTAALRGIVHDAVKPDFGGRAEVTTLRPGAARKEGPGVNVYLYRVGVNAAFANTDLPTRRPSGALVARPTLALDLQYVLSFHGDETRLEPQRLMGSALRALHARPVLGRDALRALVQNAGASDGVDAFLRDSTLPEQVESVRLSLLPLNLEEWSKLWSVFFQTPHAPSVAYQAGVVLLECDASFARALPARRLRARASAAPGPEVAAARAADGSAEVTALDTLVLTGASLSAPGAKSLARVAGVEVEAAASPRAASVDFSRLPPGTLRAGAQGVQVVLVFPDGRREESNVAPFVLRPVLAPRADGWALDVLDLAPGPGGAQGTLRAGVVPDVGARQRAVLFLNAVDSELAYALSAARRDADGPVLDFPFRDVRPGAYLVRVQVDGAESPLLVDRANPSAPYSGPLVVIP